ncbi:MAG: protoheme IX farnesyltransferase [Parachlamydiaceae bacterium]|nr:protoheme IX farnesyltransferase [Parachlamydiaceae bacterium]
MINYYLLTKPGIIFGNLLTVAAGFLLASRGNIDLILFLATLLGLAFIMASGCVFNNYIDRPLDEKMSRTKNRALVTGLISGRNAIIFGIALGVIGNLILMRYTNTLTVIIAGIGFFVYVVLYSLWKSHTIYSTAIGSIAGAVPPIVGYCAVSNNFDLGALILFSMLVLWQMPHFFSIAIYHLKDYTAAKMPVLPIQKGVFRTKVHMVIYIIAFIGSAALLTIFNYTGYVYLFVTISLSIVWLALCLRGFKSQNDTLWSKYMFQWSLVLITAICFVIPFDIR